MQLGTTSSPSELNTPVPRTEEAASLNTGPDIMAMRLIRAGQNIGSPLTNLLNSDANIAFTFTGSAVKTCRTVFGSKIDERGWTHDLLAITIGGVRCTILGHGSGSMFDCMHR